MNTINYHKKKYANEQMPEKIIDMIRGCEMNMANDDERIGRLEQKLLDLDMGVI